MIWILVLAPFILSTCEGARVLVLVPTTGRSHFIVMEPLLKELAARGHQVTVYSIFPMKKPLANYTVIDVNPFLPPYATTFTADELKKTMSNPFQTIHFVDKTLKVTCDLLKEAPFKSLWKMRGQYDLLITELFGNDCMTYFAYKLKIPLISFTTCVALPWSSDRFGLPDNPSYIPHPFANLSPEMSLLQKTYNLMTLLYTKYMYQLVFDWSNKIKAEEALGEVLPPLQEVVANTSLLLVNSYHALTQSRPFPPNVVEVGGIHIKERQPLEESLLNIIDKAENGVIVMSFGSLIKTSSLPKSVIKMFMSVFSNIPQTVVLKYEEDISDAPPNVVIRKWLPQRDLVEHEKVVAVITHGGLSSTIEAVVFNKPILGVPFFVDQFVNINNIVSKGAGIMLDLDDLSEAKIATAVKEITTNITYKESMSRLSQQYRDRPMTALQSAVYWTEYVIRHHGAPHLQPASVKLPLYQHLLLDVLALLLVTLAATLYALLRLFRFSCRTLGSLLSKRRNNIKKNK